MWIALLFKQFTLNAAMSAQLQIIRQSILKYVFPPEQLLIVI